MIEAIKIHGPLKGFWMGLRRLSKCHPWGTHGYDPVPPKNYIKTTKMNTKKFKKKN
jgi:putative component of membrane protein insertase Oxa1/YidC/SpoIIIJ protein YidD